MLNRFLLTLALLLSMTGGGVSLAASGSSDSASAPAPTITAADLETRLRQLEQAREQLIANLHNVDGMIAECKHWIEHIQADKPDAKPSAEEHK